MRRRRAHQRGFVLIETIVAFLVLAIGLASIGASMALAVRSDARIEARRTAMLLARSRLEAAGIVEALVPGRRSGGDGNRLWSETVTAVPMTSTASAGTQPARVNGLAAYWVEIIVGTSDGGAVQLAALKLAPVRAP